MSVGTAGACPARAADPSATSEGNGEQKIMLAAVNVVVTQGQTADLKHMARAMKVGVKGSRRQVRRGNAGKKKKILVPYMAIMRAVSAR